MEKNLFYKTKEKWGNYEKETGRASYSTIIEHCCDNMILNNEIIKHGEIEDWEIISGSDVSYYNGNGEEITEEEYYNDETGETYQEYDEVYQYFIVDYNDIERLKEFNQLVFYNEKFDITLLGVKHWGTSWDYVLTPYELTDNWEEYAKSKGWEQ